MLAIDRLNKHIANNNMLPTDQSAYHKITPLKQLIKIKVWLIIPRDADAVWRHVQNNKSIEYQGK